MNPLYYAEFSNMPSADFCSAVRPPFDSLSRRSDTEQISWVSSTVFRAQPPDLRFASLMDMDFAVSCPLVRHSRLVSGLVHRLALLIHASFRPRLAAVALAFSLGLHLHQVGRRTFTSKLLSMPSTQQSLRQVLRDRGCAKP